MLRTKQMEGFLFFIFIFIFNIMYSLLSTRNSMER